MVFSISLLQNVIETAPLLFLKSAENTIGEYDIGKAIHCHSSWNDLLAAAHSQVFTPQQTDARSASYYVNCTELDEKIGSRSDIVGIAHSLLSPLSLFSIAIVSTLSSILFCFPILALINVLRCGTSLGFNITCIESSKSRSSRVYRSTRDGLSQGAGTACISFYLTHAEKMNLGRSWNHAPLAMNHTHISAPLLRYLRIKPNSDQLVTFRFDLIALAHVLSLLLVLCADTRLSLVRVNRRMISFEVC